MATQTNIHRLLTMPQDSIVVDKYGGAAFTIAEISQMVVAMMHTDTKEDVDQFLARFVPKTDEPTEGES